MQKTRKKPKTRTFTRKQTLKLANIAKRHYAGGGVFRAATSDQLEKLANILMGSTQGKKNDDLRAELSRREFCAEDWVIETSSVRRFTHQFR